MSDHARELTYPAVMDLLADGEWHTKDDLTAVTRYPEEWLEEVERERTLEHRPGSPPLVRLTS
jgi:hypothetical protein